MDTAVLIAIISTAGVLATGLASIVVAVITNRKESQNAADDAQDEASRQLLEVKDERILARDERIAMLVEEKQESLQKNAATQGELQTALSKLAECDDALRSERAAHEVTKAELGRFQGDE